MYLFIGGEGRVIYVKQIIPADSTFLTMIGIIIYASQMFAQSTVIVGKFCTTVAARMTKLNNRNNLT